MMCSYKIEAQVILQPGRQSTHIYLGSWDVLTYPREDFMKLGTSFFEDNIEGVFLSFATEKFLNQQQILPYFPK